MNAWLIYFLQANICLLVFYTIYHFGLKHSKRYKYLRFYLLASLLLALLMPLIGSISPASNTVIEFDLQEVLVYQLNGNVIGVKEFSVSSIIVTAYLLGLGISGLLFIFRTLQIVRLINSGIKHQRKGYTLVSSQKCEAPFSFFNYLVVPENEKEPGAEIILHEKAHIEQFHSADVIVAEAFKMSFWYNPVAYFYQQSIKEIHEYLADAAVVEQTGEPADYIQLILSRVFEVEPQALTNTFFYTQTLAKRIRAINNTDGQAKFKWYHYGLTILAVLVTVQVSITLALPNWVTDEKKVFTKADIMPQYPGGFSELVQFIGSQVSYPQELASSDVQGTVYVKFVVDKYGDVSHIQVLKGVHPKLDEIALNSVASMPDWIPGQQDGKKVAVSLTLPIKFAL